MLILVIDNIINPPSWGSADLCRLIRLSSDATIHVRRAPQEDLPLSPESYDAIVISGSKTSILDQSPWVEKLQLWIQSALDLKKPYLGVCFGHQMLARTLGGMVAVQKAHEPEFGWSKIDLIQPHPLFDALPSSFFSFSAHFEEVAQLPRECVNLAYSTLCKIQAFQWRSLPIYGIQFHPEKTLFEVNEIFQELKRSQPHLSLLRATHSKPCFNPEFGKQIFKNFLKSVTFYKNNLTVL